MKRRITMQDIADKLGVTKVTVSKYFKGSDDISEKMKKNIARVAEELGYVYNSTKKVSVGVLTPSVFLEKDEDFYTQIYKNLTEDANQYNIHLILNVVKDEEEESCKLPYILQDGSIDALIVLGQLSKEFIRFLLDLKIPIVLIDFHYRDIDLDTIVSNNFQASYEITSYLMDCGHKQIGFVGNIKTTTSVQDRYLGYRKALLENNLLYNESYLIEDRDQDNNLIQMKLPKTVPTAFVCNNDFTAFLLVKKLKDNGYRIPEDVSVVGFDDVQYSEFSEPKLTTVRVNRGEMSKLALKSVHKRINQQNLKSMMLVTDTEIVFRDSVKKINE